MTPPALGELTYDPDAGEWFGFARLPAFAAHLVRQGDPPAADPDHLARQLRDEFALVEATPRRIPTPPPEDRDTEWDEPDATPEQEAEWGRAARRNVLDELQRRRGLTPVRLPDGDKAGPSPQQDAAAAYLAANDAALRRAVLEQLLDAESRYGRAGRLDLRDVTVYREHHNGTSYLGFALDGWDDEHGFVVVCHPDKPAAWTTVGGLYDLVESDDHAEATPTPHQLFFDAIAANDLGLAAELRAAGADINAVAPGETPPLCLAVMGMDAALVERLLAAGADPNLSDPADGRTPLRKALREMHDLGFRRPNRPPWYMWLIWLAMNVLARRELNEHRAQLGRIVRLLEAARSA